MSINNTDLTYMQRCIQLARKGMGYVAPNPLVGAVIVCNDKIIGEGYHQHFGGPHAEVNAINNVADHTLLKESTIYVNLEPCSHIGKTPACSQLLIANQIKRVVIGIQDPFPKVNGNGVKQLREAGIDVEIGVLENECKLLNKRFITFYEKKRPYIILKWAESADGFIGKQNQKIRISNEESRFLNFQWRSQESAILIGSKTANNDNPQLNLRDWKGNNPIRLILSESGNLKSDLIIFDGLSKTVIFTKDKNQNFPNCETIHLDEGDSIPQLSNYAFERGIQSIIVEGGTKTIQQFIDGNLWDEMRIFKSHVELKEGIKAPKYNATNITVETIKDNLFYQVTNNALPFA